MSNRYVHRGSAAYIDQFWQRVDVREVGDCWEWTRGRLPTGYGQTRSGTKTHKAHRLAWCLANGTDIPEGLVVIHSCDNPPCCNPAHLRIGTHRENHDDSKAKRRRWYQSRTMCKSGKHELTEATVKVRGNSVTCVECRRESHRAQWRSRSPDQRERAREVRSQWAERNRERMNRKARERYADARGGDVRPHKGSRKAWTARRKPEAA